MTTSTPIATVMVAGSGVMGLGIAEVFAKAGFETTVYRHRPKDGLKLPEGVKLVTSFDGKAPDIVIESIPEVLDLKIEFFQKLEAAFGERTIIASNTSGLPLEDMAAKLKHPNRFLGMHYFMPAEVSPLVEVIRVAKTDDTTVDRVVAALAKAGRESLILTRPVVGFLWNRLQHAILHEAYHLIETGVASTEDVDKVAKKLFGPRFCISGLVESKDIGGLETHIRAQHAIVPHLHLDRKPCAILERKRERKEFGISTGKGFYDWSGRSARDISDSAKRRLRKLNAFLDTELNRGEANTGPVGMVPPD